MFLKLLVRILGLNAFENQAAPFHEFTAARAHAYTAMRLGDPKSLSFEALPDFVVNTRPERSSRFRRAVLLLHWVEQAAQAYLAETIDLKLIY